MLSDQDEHWHALLGSGEAIGRFIEDQSSGLALFAANADGSVATYRSVAGPIGCMLRVARTAGTNFAPTVVYPAPAGPDAVALQIRDIVDHADGGVIVNASFHGMAISYYDTSYDYDRAAVESASGRSAAISLAGIALRAYISPPERLEAGQLSRHLAALVPASILYPETPARPDWFAFSSPVKNVWMTQLADEELYMLEVCLLRPDDIELIANLYVSQYVTSDDFAPNVGDVVSGVLWLTGYELRQAI